VSDLWQWLGNKSFLLLFFKKEVLAFACLFSPDVVVPKIGIAAS
jgi:hypothetical protein